MTRARKLSQWVVIAGAALAVPCSSLAVALRLPNQDPEAIARGNAFAATADNPSAIYYNPAGITQLEGQQARMGVYLISADTSFTSPSGAKAETDASFQGVPQVYYTISPTNFPLSFGVGVYAPEGLSLDYGTHSPLRTVAESGSLLHGCCNPVVAWRVLPNLSVGIGPNIFYSKAELAQGFTTINPNDQFKFSGSGWGFGFNAGLLYQPLKKWSVGLNYHSAYTITYDGHTETAPSSPPPYFPATSTKATINYPQTAVGGISFRPTENWNFEFDLDWTEWQVLKEIVFRGTPLGNLPLVLNFHSSYMYEFGATRQLGKGFSVSAGYFYSENSSPSQNFDPIVPDVDLHLFNVGIAHRGQRWDWALSYTAAYNPGRTISNDVNSLANGTYKTLNNAINIAFTYKF